MRNLFVCLCIGLMLAPPSVYAGEALPEKTDAQREEKNATKDPTTTATRQKVAITNNAVDKVLVRLELPGVIPPVSLTTVQQFKAAGFIPLDPGATYVYEGISVGKYQIRAVPFNDAGPAKDLAAQLKDFTKSLSPQSFRITQDPATFKLNINDPTTANNAKLARYNKSKKKAKTK